MSPITITDKKETDAGWEFAVETPAGTKHTVTLSRDYYQELTDEAVTPKRFVWASFSFLLQRESSADIMSSFALSDIQTFFPEYPEVIREEISDSNNEEDS
ncbi:MAG: hypothetical protein WD335_03125 [Candidatus Paceibacterota bacterium]